MHHAALWTLRTADTRNEHKCTVRAKCPPICGKSIQTVARLKHSLPCYQPHQTHENWLRVHSPHAYPWQSTRKLSLMRQRTTHAKFKTARVSLLASLFQLLSPERLRAASICPFYPKGTLHHFYEAGECLGRPPCFPTILRRALYTTLNELCRVVSKLSGKKQNENDLRNNEDSTMDEPSIEDHAEALGQVRDINLAQLWQDSLNSRCRMQDTLCARDNSLSLSHPPLH